MCVFAMLIHNKDPNNFKIYTRLQHNACFKLIAKQILHANNILKNILKTLWVILPIYNYC